MSADFWSGYASGAIGILVGNPLDIIKTRLQAGPPEPLPATTTATTSTSPSPKPATFTHWTSLARGATAPILGYGALNALLFVTYNRSLAVLSPDSSSASVDPTTVTTTPAAWKLFTAGALGGLATFVVSAPTELVKCRAQVSSPPRSSAEVARGLWRGEAAGSRGGVRGWYLGGGVTAVRDAVGYGF